MIEEHLLEELRPERIGHRLMLLREAVGLKPSEMADALGIERTYWSRFEGGRRPLTMPIAALLVDRFGVTLDFLLLGRWGGVPLDLANAMQRMETSKRQPSPGGAAGALPSGGRTRPRVRHGGGSRPQNPDGTGP